MLERLGPYLIDEQIGQGGMGFVYSATHEESGDAVAVKMLSNALSDDHNFRERFHQEIETLQQLQHEGIVQIFGYGQEEDTLFYAMELVEGRTLYQLLKESGPITWREVIRITIDICHALKHAHDRGVIHRDLKPSNLFLTHDDQVKLVDFGIARLFGATQLTADHAVVGTADYMAPEQAAGARPTIKSDLYSLGSVMYALLTGRPPFAAPAVAHVIHKLKYDQPQPINELVADIPLELDYIVRQLLSKKPDSRIPTPLAVAHRLQAMQHALDSNMPERSPGATVEMNELDSDTDGATREFVTNQADGNHENTIDGQYSEEFSPSADPPTVSDEQFHQQDNTGPEGEQTHYTTVERDRFESEKSRPSGVLASLLVLMALIVGVGGLLVFTNWYNQPKSADQLLEIINDAQITPGSDWGQASVEMREFIQRFPEHARFQEVEDYYNKLKSEREEQRFLKWLESTSSEMSVAKLTLRGILKQESDSPEKMMELLENFITLYQNRADDFSIDECVTYARNKLERLRQTQVQQLAQQQLLLSRHRKEIQEVVALCRQISKEEPASAIAILKAIYQIHKDTPELAEALETVSELQAELSEVISSSGS